MTRWLVTGASGFLGANVPENLPAGSVPIAATRAGRRVAGYAASVKFDLSVPTSFREALETAQPDVVLHAAALSSHAACETEPELAMTLNAHATEEIAQACAATGTHLIYISTDAVFDGHTGGYREDDHPQPFSAYGRSKLAGEYAALELATALVTRVNFFGWSPSGERSILEFFVNAARDGRAVPGYRDYTVNSAYVADTVKAIAHCFEGQRTGLVHVTAPDALSKSDFGVAVIDQLGADSALVTPTSRPGGPLNLSLDVSRLESWLGWVPRPQLAAIGAALADEPER